MKLLNNKYILAILLSSLLSCNDDFLERYPETSLAPEAFFKTTQDLKLYTNTYYEYVVPEWFDYVSDNCVSYAESSEYNNLLRGSITPQTVSGWSKDDWGRLRRLNLFMDHVHNASGVPDEINHYTGITRLERALFYFDLVKKYNDVPWYSHALTDTNEEMLYKARDPRTSVVDSILADLNYATEHISDNMGDKTQFNKWYALAMKARFCLFEGTFRKYHKELNLETTADFFLNEAANAANTIIESGKFGIDKGNGPETAYWRLFNNYDLSGSPEIILFKNYSSEYQIRHSAAVQTYNWVTSYSRSLMESYQYIREDGTVVPFSSLPEHDKKTFIEIFNNRDPRLSQCFMYPGFIPPGAQTPGRPNMNLGGYPVIKYMPETADQFASKMQYTDLPVSRYAEVLLIYAEAKAELGTINQNDLDISVNQIRSRVNMPPTIIGSIVEDQSLKKQFPNISNYLLLDIRRERRIELVNENFRWDDLIRWDAGHLLAQVQEGLYIDKLGLFDVTGDGIPEIGIFENETSNTVPDEERDKYSFYYLKSNEGALNTFSLSEGDHGHIIMNVELNSRRFLAPQYYYFPIPQTQITLNPNLEQTIFWDK